MHNKTHAETNSIQNEQVKALFEEGVVRSSSEELEQLFDTCTAPFVKAGVFERVAVFLLNKAARSLELTFGSGLSPSGADLAGNYSLSMADTDHLVARVGRTGIHEYHESTETIPSIQDDPLIKQFTPGRFAVVPLPVRGMTMGVLIAGSSDTGPFSEEHRALLHSLTSQFNLSLENVILQKNLNSETQKLQNAHEQIVQSEKLSTLGLLVASVAHEINNPLTGIMGYAEALWKSSNRPEIQDLVEKILRELERTRRIIRSILSFAKNAELKKTSSDLSDLLEKSIEVMSPELVKHNITLVKNFDPGCFSLVDLDQIHQVFSNIVNNAIHAVEERESDRRITIEAVKEGTQAVIRFKDNGHGISPENMKNIFVPFFTTKKAHKGTGLGLSIANNIVESHGGYISAENSSRNGTTFCIRLPLIDTTVSGRSNADKSTPQGLSILIVDDEVAIQESLREILKIRGNHVDTVGTGRDAFSMIHRHPYDIIICDLKLPDVNADNMYYEMQDMGALLKKTIFISGDTTSKRVHEFLTTTGAHYLSKPFHPTDLHKKIHEIIEGSTNSTNHFAA